MKTLKLSVSPHIHSGRSTAGIMRDVLISLLPATIAGVVIFGIKSLAVIAACVISCVGFEFLYNLIVRREQTVTDLSAAVTGLLLALNLGADTPVWQCVIGSFFAIIIVKALFGGIGYNLVNNENGHRIDTLNGITLAVKLYTLTVNEGKTISDNVTV